MTHRPLVSYVYLAYEAPDLVSASLSSICNQTHSNKQIICVVNPGRRTSEVTSAIQAFPEVSLFCLDSNQGFTGAMNFGISKAQGDYIQLTEDDMSLDAHCTERFVEFSQNNHDASLLTGSILTRGGTIVACGGELAIHPEYRKRLCYEGERRELTKPFKISYASGAMMFGHKNVWNRLGRFREDFFVYYEDDDLCLRAKAQGVEIYCVPHAQAVTAPPRKYDRKLSIEICKVRNRAALLYLHNGKKALAKLLAQTPKDIASALLRGNLNHATALIFGWVKFFLRYWVPGLFQK